MKKKLVQAGTAVLGIGAIVVTVFLAGIVESPQQIAPHPSSYQAKEGKGLIVNYAIGERGNVTVEEIHTESPNEFVLEMKNGKSTGKRVLAKDAIVVNRKVKNFKKPPTSYIRRRVSR